MGGATLEIRLIGTVEVLRDGVPVALPGRRVRALAALLALSAGRTVPIETLARGIWDDDPPARVRGSLQTYIGRLRPLVGGDVIVTEPSGYRLDVPRACVDLLAFVDAAEAAYALPDPAAQRAALGKALAQWVDEPFGDSPSEWMARHEAPSWTERYLQAVERRSDLDIDAGDHARCVVELNRHVERHPLRETLWTRLLTALDRSGRTAEALERYESVRKRLAEELGVDPSPELRAVYGELLDRTTEAVPAPDRDPTATPRQLPVRLSGFVGRADQLTRLDGLLPEVASDDQPGVIALHGPAGSGKTSLAVHWAHRIADRFPDGQLFLNLQGYGPGDPVGAPTALDTLLRTVGVRGERIPSHQEGREQLWRSTLADRRMLVLLDNANDPDVVRALLPGSRSLALVTSRNQLRSLAARDGAVRVPVDRMPADDAVELLGRRIGREVSPDDLAELAALCDHLPVALAVAAERADRYPDRGLGDLNAALRDRQRRLSALSASDDPLTSVRSVLDWSYQALDDETARLFRHLGLYEAPRISTGAAAALAGTGIADTECFADRLADCHLLRAAAPGWYETHDLVRDFAADLARSTETDEQRDVATRRLWNWFLHSTRNARETISPQRSVAPEFPDEPGVTPETFDSAQAASDWLAAHAPYLLAVVDDAAAADHPAGYLLPPELFVHLNIRSTLHAAGPLYHRAEAAAARAGDLLAQAECANSLGGVYSENGDYRQALECARRARDLYERAGEPTGTLKADSNIALTLQRLDRLDEALQAYQRLVRTARESDLPTQYAIGLGDLSQVYLALERPREALDAATEGVERLRGMDNTRALAHGLEYLGDAHLATAEPDAAVASYREACELLRRLGADTFEATTLAKLGSTYRDLGRVDEARAAWRRAVSLLDAVTITETYDISREQLLGLLADLDEHPPGPSGRSAEAAGG